MTNKISSLESATKYLSPSDKDRFFKLKRELEASGISRTTLEERLRAFLWQIVDEDDEDEEDGDEE